MDEIKKLLADHNNILEHQNKILSEQNNVLRAGILAFIQEFSLYRFYAINELKIPADEVRKMHDGCEGYASTNLYDLLRLAESYSSKSMKNVVDGD